MYIFEELIYEFSRLCLKKLSYGQDEADHSKFVWIVTRTLFKKNISFLYFSNKKEELFVFITELDFISVFSIQHSDQ